MADTASAGEREWGHRYTHDGTIGPDESQGAAFALAKRFQPGYVEVVWRRPGGEWQRADAYRARLLCGRGASGSGFVSAGDLMAVLDGEELPQ